MDSDLTFIAITVFEDQVLLMKRTTPPLCWGPPSGHCQVGEAMAEAIHREMHEETGNTCTVLMPVATWQGFHRDREVFNVTYVCELASLAVTLSEEHSAYRWIPISSLVEEARDLTLLDLTDWPLLIRLAREYAREKP